MIGRHHQEHLWDATLVWDLLQTKSTRKITVNDVKDTCQHILDNVRRIKMLTTTIYDNLLGHNQGQKLLSKLVECRCSESILPNKRDNFPIYPVGLTSLSLVDQKKWAWNKHQSPFPDTLQSLTLDIRLNEIQQSDLPSSLQFLTLGDEYNRPLPTLPSTLQGLSLGEHFNQDLLQITLPSTLTALRLGPMFNSKLELNHLTQLQTLHLRRYFLSRELFALPTSLTNLECTIRDTHFHLIRSLPELETLILTVSPQGVNTITLTTSHLPKTLHRLELTGRFSLKLQDAITIKKMVFHSYNHEKPLRQGSLPKNLSHLTIFLVNTIEDHALPQTLQFLEFVVPNLYNKGTFNHLPSNLQTLILPDNRNRSLPTLPISLRRLKVGNTFNQPINLTNHTNLLALELGESFNQPFQVDDLPSQLETLTLGQHYNQPLLDRVLPSNLQTLTILNHQTQLVRSVLPPSLVTLIIPLKSFFSVFQDEFKNTELPNLNWLTVNQGILPKQEKKLPLHFPENVFSVNFTGHFGRFKDYAEKVKMTYKHRHIQVLNKETTSD